MGYFRFRRSIKVLPGVRWNIGKKSTSVSFGGRGFTYTIGTKGSRTTVGIPGTGISYTQVHTSKPGSTALPPPPPPAPLSTSTSTQTTGTRKSSSVFYALGFIMLAIWLLTKFFDQNAPKLPIAETSSSPTRSIPFASTSPGDSYHSPGETHPSAETSSPHGTDSVNPDDSPMEVRRALMVESPPLVRTYRVVNVTARDTLNLRAGPGSKYRVVAKIPARGRGITLGQKRTAYETTMWQEVFWDGHVGWINETYIEAESPRR